jgi:O-antigen/teichoic acid export membrane protein
VFNRLRISILRRQAYLPPVHSGATVNRQVVQGGVWAGVNVGGAAVVQLIRSVVFAHLLLPADFGVIGLADVFTQFILLFANFGFNASIVYRSSVDREDLATCWWGNLFVDCAAGVICVAAALVSSRFDPSSQVPTVIALLASQYVITSLASVNEALMNRLFLFKANALVSIGGSAVGFLAALAGVAVWHLGVYGLVLGMIVGTIVTTALRMSVVPWLPSWSWSWSRLKTHVRYGRWFLGVSLVRYTNANADRFFIGAFLSPAQLGYYDYAAAMPMLLAIRFGAILNQVLFPAIASLQNNLPELRQLLVRYFRFTALLLDPMMFGLSVVAEEFVGVAYGPRWSPIVVPLEIFCAVGTVIVISNPLYSLCNGVGMPWLPFRSNLIVLPLNAAAVYLGATYMGVTGTAIAKLLVPVLSVAFIGRPVFKHVGLRFLDVGRAVVPGLAASSAMALSVAVVRVAVRAAVPFDAIRLAVMVILGVAAYFLVLFAVWPADLRWLVSLLRQGAMTVAGRERGAVVAESR